MSALSNSIAAQGGTAPSPKLPFFQRPPAPDPGPPNPALFSPIYEARGWNFSPPSNQRKARKARRQAHANGKRNAFAR
jgi:hypothetical protein